MVNNRFLSDVVFNRKNIKLSLLVSVLYLFFLIKNLPAQFVISSLSLPANITISSVSGTIWSGKINKFKYAGIDFGAANWKLKPLFLLVGELSADVSFNKNNQYINSEVYLSPSGKIEFYETRFFINLSSLQPLIYGMPFSYGGEVTGYLPVSHFFRNNYVGINGELILNNIQMITPQQQLFGDFMLTLRAEKEGGTLGQLKDKSDVMDASGLLTLSKNGEVNISIRLTANETGSPVDNMISFLGAKDKAGRVHLNNRFKLWN